VTRSGKSAPQPSTSKPWTSNRLVSLWQEHYDRISEAGKALLPLVKVYFLAPAEE